LIQWIKSALNGLYPFVFQRFPEPISVMAAVGQQPLRLWQAAQQRRHAGAVADLARRHEEADRAARSLVGPRHLAGQPLAELLASAPLILPTPEAALRAALDALEDEG
jgi:hypothetical protein